MFVGRSDYFFSSSYNLLVSFPFFEFVRSLRSFFFSFFFFCKRNDDQVVERRYKSSSRDENRLVKTVVFSR